MPATNGDLAQRIETIENLRKQGDYASAQTLAQESLALAETTGESEWEIETLYQMALLQYLQDNYEQSKALLEIAISKARKTGNISKEADLLNLMGNMLWKESQFAAATTVLKEALGLFQRLENKLSMASAANNLGNVQASLNDHEQAVLYFRQGLEWANEAPAETNLRMRASLLSNLGESLLGLGKLDEAETYLLQSLEVERVLDEPRDLAFSFTSLGNLYAALKDIDKAYAFHQQALDIQIQLNDQWASTITRLRLSETLLANNRPFESLEVLNAGFDDARRLKSLELLQQYTKQLYLAYTTTGEDALASYFADLSRWFEQRRQVESGLMDAVEPVVTAIESQESNSNTRLFSARWGSIGILFIIVMLLLFENTRLRRLGQREEA